MRRLEIAGREVVAVGVGRAKRRRLTLWLICSVDSSFSVVKPEKVSGAEEVCAARDSWLYVEAAIPTPNIAVAAVQVEGRVKRVDAIVVVGVGAGSWICMTVRCCPVGYAGNTMMPLKTL